jgi:hypothetical protein
MMAGYLKFKYDTKKLKLKKPEITIYPIVCWHIGAEESDTHFIKEHIARIKADPTARVVYLGDGGECVTRNSKGDVFAQTMSPQQQQEALIKLLTPIKDKLLFGVRGNHGHRVYKETGLDFDNSLCNALGIPYMGVCTFCNILVNRSSYDLYFHHGLDSGVSPQTKVSSAEKFTKFIDADAIFTAHSHYATELMPALIRRCDNGACKITDRSRKQYICGSAYDSRTGYAEDKGYPPLTPAHISVTLDGRIIEGTGVKKQTYRKYE